MRDTLNNISGCWAMHKVFADMFSKRPDEIADGDYFFVSDQNKTSRQYARRLDAEFERFRENIESQAKFDFSENWEKKTLSSECTDEYPWLGDEACRQEIRKLARDARPFMDIASGDGMGLAPFIIRENPDVPCLLTDTDAQLMKRLRAAINSRIPNYNISIAAFDCSEIPIRSGALDCITSLCGLSELCRSWRHDNTRTTVRKSRTAFGIDKVIAEVYRVLAPGGKFVLTERSVVIDHDLEAIREHCEKYGKLAGIYEFEEIKEILRQLDEEPWRDMFLSAGFEIEVERVFPRKYSKDKIKEFLYLRTYYGGLRKWSESDVAKLYMSKEAALFLQQAQSREEFSWTNDALLGRYSDFGGLVREQGGRPGGYFPSEIALWMWESRESDDFRRYMDQLIAGEDDLAGIEIYEADYFYVLRKPIK